MYESFYGLKEKPFELHPDPDFLYMSSGHDNAYTHLKYAIDEHKGFVVVTGEVGSGKTTLVNFLLRKIDQTIHVGIINNTAVAPDQFLKMICHEFEVPITGLDKAEILNAFNDYLLLQFSRNNRVVLIIDEAQGLPAQTIEEVRMLSNLEGEKHHLIQIILSGQPELRQLLQQPQMRQFAQRVAVHCNLAGLSMEEVEEYIKHRLKIAGAVNADIFSADAIRSVWLYSAGVPRIINQLCDMALVFGFGEENQTIGPGIIEEVALTRQDSGYINEIAEASASLSFSPQHADALRITKKLAKELQINRKRLRAAETAITELTTKVDFWEVRTKTLVDLMKQAKQRMLILKEKMENFSNRRPI